MDNEDIFVQLICKELRNILAYIYVCFKSMIHEEIEAQRCEAARPENSW